MQISPEDCPEDLQWAESLKAILRTESSEKSIQIEAQQFGSGVEMRHRERLVRCSPSSTANIFFQEVLLIHSQLTLKDSPADTQLWNSRNAAGIKSEVTPLLTFFLFANRNRVGPTQGIDSAI